MTVSKGRDTYAATHTTDTTTDDAALVQTGIGRGRLRRRAMSGDQTARDLLQQHGIKVAEERAAYDDFSGGGTGDD